MWSRAALIVALTVAGTGWAAEPAPLGKPSCVVVTLRDADNLPIPTAQPIIGMMIAGRPMMVGSIPGYSAMSIGATAPCTDALVREANATYGDSCLTTERRKQTAQTYRIDETVVAKNCTELRAALGDALETVAR